MPGKSGTAARHPAPRFALVILSGAHRLDSGRPSLPDWSTQVDPKQSSSRGALNAYSCLLRSSAAPLGRLRRPQAIRSATQTWSPFERFQREKRDSFRRPLPRPPKSTWENRGHRTSRARPARSS